jgi:hypothetical protein
MGASFTSPNPDFFIPSGGLGEFEKFLMMEKGEGDGRFF